MSTSTLGLGGGIYLGVGLRQSTAIADPDITGINTYNGIGVVFYSPSQERIASLTAGLGQGEKLETKMNFSKYGNLKGFQISMLRNNEIPFFNGMKVEFYYKNLPFAYGYVDSFPESDQISSVVKIGGKGYVNKLRDKKISVNYASKTIEYILDDLGSTYFLDLGFNYNSSKIQPPNTTISSVDWSEKDLLKIIQDLISISNTNFDTIEYIYGIDQYGDFYFKGISEDEIEKAYFEGYNYQNPIVENDASNLVNQVQLYRTTDADDKETEYVDTFEDSDSIDMNGLYERKVTFSDFIDNTTAENAANGIIADLKDPKTRLTINDLIIDSILNYGFYALSNKRQDQKTVISDFALLSDWSTFIKNIAGSEVFYAGNEVDLSEWAFISTNNGTVSIGNPGLDGTVGKLDFNIPVGGGGNRAYANSGGKTISYSNYMLSYYIDTDSLTIGVGESFINMYGYYTAAISIKSQIRNNAGQYQILISVLNDAAGWTDGTWTNISAGEHLFQVVYKKASTAIANDGGWHFYIDGALQESVLTVDIFTNWVSTLTLHLGLRDGVDAGTLDSLFIDEVNLIEGDKMLIDATHKTAIAASAAWTNDELIDHYLVIGGISYLITDNDSNQLTLNSSPESGIYDWKINYDLNISIIDENVYTGRLCYKWEIDDNEGDLIEKDVEYFSPTKLKLFVRQDITGEYLSIDIDGSKSESFNINVPFANDWTEIEIDLTEWIKVTSITLTVIDSSDITILLDRLEIYTETYVKRLLSLENVSYNIGSSSIKCEQATFGTEKILLTEDLKKIDEKNKVAVEIFSKQ